jgi:hypothetical protein
VNANSFTAVLSEPGIIDVEAVGAMRRCLRVFATAEEPVGLPALTDEFAESYRHGGFPKPPAARWRARWRTTVVLVNGAVIDSRHCQQEHKE